MLKEAEILEKTRQMPKGNSGQCCETVKYLEQNSEDNFQLADIYWTFTHQNMDLVLKLMAVNIMKMKVGDEMS